VKRTMSKLRVEIREGNRTLRQLMRDALSKSGIDAVVRDEPPQDDEACDMLVVDLDSGMADLEDWVERYDELELPVLFLGVKHSRDRFPQREWLGRPFSPTSFMAQCFDALDFEGDSYGNIRISGDDDPITATGLSNHALVLRNLGRTEEAVPLYGEAIEASVENGVLHLVLPKKDSHRTRRIEIQAA